MILFFFGGRKTEVPRERRKPKTNLIGNQTLVTSFGGKLPHYCTIPAYVILNLPVFSYSSATVTDLRVGHILTLEILDLSSPNSPACWQYSCVSQSPSWVQFPPETDFWLPHLLCLEIKSCDQFWRNLSMTLQFIKSRENNCLKGTKILFSGSGLTFFSPLLHVGTNSEWPHLSRHIFWAQYSKSDHKSSRCGSFKVKHPKKTAFWSILIKRYDEPTLSSLYGRLPPGVSLINCLLLV